MKSSHKQQQTSRTRAQAAPSRRVVSHAAEPTRSDTPRTPPRGAPKAGDAAASGSPVTRSYQSLTLRDLLAAREAYHVHLVRKAHVRATAIGLYLARTSDGGEQAITPEERIRTIRPGSLEPRTLENSALQPWSWPCVLVFVDDWMNEDDIRESPDEMVPRRLYLPDGTVVPTCVVFAPSVAGAPPEEHLNFPTGLIGGGYLCASSVQQRERVGSIACLVSDGDLTYALTNRHVVGAEPGRVMKTIANGAYTRIGTTAAHTVSRLPFTAVYPRLPGSGAEVAIDAGLIRVDDVNSWTTQVFGVGRVESVVDISDDSLTLDIIGTPVRAFGAASGLLTGEIMALFYRYATRAGIEYVADALIGPRGSEPLRTRPGDSGTLWLVDDGEAGHGGQTPSVTALAMEWGGERLLRSTGGTASPYALATFLSNVCRQLDVEVVYDWNADQQLYWGQVAHYTIAAKACEAVSDTALRSFFLANRQNISFDLDDVAAGRYHSPDGTPFYPLADVPDLVWKSLRGYVRPHEKPNHFADMDAEVDGKSLLSLFREDPSTVTPERWLDFYKRLGRTPSNMGLLPFRVAQMYATIVDGLRAGGDDGIARALCAAGTMAHYVADACEPLHISQFNDGRDATEKGVHGAYETDMINKKRTEIIDEFDRALAEIPVPAAITGDQVASTIAGLMSDTFERLSPTRICEVFAQTGGDVDQMWDALGDATIACQAAGCRMLAVLWASAWAEAQVPPPAPEALDPAVIRNLYRDQHFAPSRYLTELVREPVASARRHRRPQGRARPRPDAIRAL